MGQKHILLKHYMHIMVTAHKLQTAEKDKHRPNWKEKLVIMEKKIHLGSVGLHTLLTFSMSFNPF